MIKNKFFTVFMIIAVLLTIMVFAPGCKKVEGYADPITENILIALNESDFEKFSRDFDENLKGEVSIASFPSLLAEINGKAGYYIEDSKKMVSVKTVDNRTAVFYSADFEGIQDVSITVVFQQINNKPTVVGFWFE